MDFVEIAQEYSVFRYALIKNAKACKNLLDSVLESGRLLIYTTRDRNIDLEETVKEKIEGREIATLEICPMYKETRDCLVSNVGRIFEKTNDEIEAVKASLDYMAQCQTGMLSFTPSNTLQYIKYFFQGGANRRLIADAAIWDWYHRAKTTAKPPARQGG